MKYYLIMGILFAGNPTTFLEEDCINEVWEIEKQLFDWDYNKNNSTVYLNYIIHATDWDGKVETDEIKIYRNENSVHFYSRQADIFQDAKEVFIILKTQKLILKNDAPRDLIDIGISKEFKTLRELIKKESEIIECNSSSGSSIKTLELKLQGEISENLFVEKIKYKYDLNKRKILQTTLEYRSGYKVKKIVIKFQELDFDSSYKFSRKARKYVLDNKGQPKGKYTGFELSVD